MCVCAGLHLTRLPVYTQGDPCQLSKDNHRNSIHRKNIPTLKPLSGPVGKKLSKQPRQKANEGFIFIQDAGSKSLLQ